MGNELHLLSCHFMKEEEDVSFEELDFSLVSGNAANNEVLPGNSNVSNNKVKDSTKEVKNSDKDACMLRTLQSKITLKLLTSKKKLKKTMNH